MSATMTPTPISDAVTVPAAMGTTRFLTGAATTRIPVLPVSFQNQSPWTIELWFSADAITDAMTLVTRAGEFTLACDGGTLTAAMAGQTVPLVYPTTLARNIFWYVAVQYDGQTMSMYLDGALVAQATTSASPAATGNPLTIGSGFYGEIQGLRVWNYAVRSDVLADNQWNTFPSGTQGLLTQLDFTAWPARDTSGHAVVPTYSQGVTYQPFTPATALATNSFCDPYNDEAVNPGGTTAPFSVAAWICPTAITDTMFVFTNGIAESTSGMTLGVAAGGAVTFQVGNSPTLVSTGVLATDVWTHVAATWAADTGTIYLNGAPDSTAATMTLDSTMAAGEPLIGAIASSGTQLPINSFQGFMQSVTVWNTALTQAQIQQAMAAPSVQDDPTCVAEYDLAFAPAQNIVSLNPVGLVAGAAMRDVPLSAQVATPGLRAATPGLRAGTAEAPQRADGAPQPSGSAARTVYTPRQSAAQIREFLGSPEVIDSAIDEYERLLGASPLTAVQRTALRAQFERKLRAGQVDFLANQPNIGVNCRIERCANGHNRLIHIHEDGETVVYEGELSACVLWCISLIVAVVGALFTALGLACNYTRFLSGYTTFLGTRINSIGLMPQLTALFSGGVTASKIFTSLKLLHEYSLLIPLVKLSWGLLSQSVTWWTVLSVGVRLLLMLSPCAPLEVLWLIAQLAYSVYSIYTIVQQRPQGCL
jgi:hypothetical protein